MSTHITCPGCGRRLILPSDCTAEVLSCPRCLSRIDNPQAGSTAYAVQGEAPPVRDIAVTPSPTSLERGSRIADLDVDVTRDTRRTGCLMILLPVIGGAGIAFSLFNVVAGLPLGEFRPALFLIGMLTVLTLLSAVWEARHQKGTFLRNGTFFGRTILGVLTISGAIIAVGGLLSFAAFILLFAVCLYSIGKR